MFDDISNSYLETDMNLGKEPYIDSETSGSTCVSVLIFGRRILCANLGDSCAGHIFLNNEGRYELEMLNREHTPNLMDERKRVLEEGGRIEPFKGIQNFKKFRSIWQICWTSKSLEKV